MIHSAYVFILYPLPAINYPLPTLPMKSFTVDKFEATQRIDRFLAKKFPGCPQSLIHKWIRTKKVKLDKKKVTPNTLLSVGDVVQLYVQDDVLGSFHDRKEGRLVEVNKNLISQYIRVIHEDENILVLDKPADIAVHQGLAKKEKGFHEHSLLEIVRAYCKTNGETHIPSLVHRLDKFTSGVLLCGKNPISLRFYSEVFRDHKNEKVYLALVKGRLKKPVGEIRLSLEKFDDEIGKVRVALEGKLSRTKYREVATFGNEASLIEVSLETGRMHQIRVHFAALGHPLAGDYVYGNKRWNDYMRKEYGLKRIFLHAAMLKLPKMEGKGYLTFESPLPPELEKPLKSLENRGFQD